MKLNDIVDKAYCINLSHRQDRWINFSRRAKEIGLEVERFEAINGFHMNPNRFPEIKRGAAGCKQSQYLIFIDAIINGYESIAIFEDDAFFHKDFNNEFSKFYSQVPDDWDFLWFAVNKNFRGNWVGPLGEGMSSASYWENKVSDNVIKIGGGLAAHAFVIRGEAIAAAATALDERQGPCDVVYAEIQNEYNAYCSSPALCGQVYPDFSDIEQYVTDSTLLYDIEIPREEVPPEYLK